MEQMAIKESKEAEALLDRTDLQEKPEKREHLVRMVFLVLTASVVGMEKLARTDTRVSADNKDDLGSPEAPGLKE